MQTLKFSELAKHRNFSAYGEFWQKVGYTSAVRLDVRGRRLHGDVVEFEPDEEVQTK